jgi:hypothetical protein
MAGLEVQIGADTSDLTKKIKEAELALKELSQVKLDRIKLGLDTKEIDGNIKSVKKSLVDLKTVNKDTGNSFSAMAPKIANGSNSLMQFSRIAQDAPFGIMGIGNNITATAESFGHLVKETGSAGGALKAVASSMLGTGGILLAVSLVTSGLTYMSQNGLTVSDVFNKLSGTFDETAKSMADLNVEAAKNSAGGIAEMNAYVSTAKNVNLSMSDRLIAVKKLQDEYPAYFGNLSQETILNGNVAKAVKGVTDALINKAKAAAAVGKIVDLAEKEEIIQNKIADEVGRQSEMAGKSKKQNEEVLKIVNDVLRGNVKLSEILNNTSNRQSYLNAIQADALLRTSTSLKDLGSELRSNIALQDKYTQKVNESTAAQIKLETKPEKVVKAKKTYSTPQVIGIKSEIDSSGLKDLSGQVVQIAKNIQGAEGMITTSMGNINVAVDTSLIDLLEKMYKFNDQLSSIVTNGTVNALSGIGEAIGEAMSTGSNIIDAVGKSILGSMGAMLKDLGKATIAYGVGLIAIKAAIKNPYLAIAAGVAMVALGSVMSNAVSKSSSSALGGGGKSSGSGGSVNTGASYSSPASSGSYSSNGGGFGGTVVFEISGTSLIGVLNNSLDRNKRLGN